MPKPLLASQYAALFAWGRPPILWNLVDVQIEVSEYQT
jgi:hypothetical protein